MPQREPPSPLTVNRLSIYLRCLRRLEMDGVDRTSSAGLATRFDLSASQIRKDLAQFGEFGIRGFGYKVEDLRRRLERLLGLDRAHRAVVVGAGNLGTALARSPGFNSPTFQVVALFDNDARKRTRADLEQPIFDSHEIGRRIPELEAEIGVLTVPASAAQENYDALADAGIAAVLNFAPRRLVERPEVPVKTVDILIFMEELAFRLGWRDDNA